MGKFLTMRQVAKRLKRCYSNTCFLERNGKIPRATLVGRRKLFSAADIEAFLATNDGELPACRGRRTRPGARSRAIKLLDAGDGVGEVARRLKLPRRTVARFDLDRRRQNATKRDLPE